MPARNLVRALAVAVLVLALDRALELLVVEGLDLRTRLFIPVFEPWLNLTMAWNGGVELGLFDFGAGPGAGILVALALGIVAVLLVWVRRGGWVQAGGAGAIIGGALGNVWDRVQYGAVADFINMSCCGIPQSVGLQPRRARRSPEERRFSSSSAAATGRDAPGRGALRRGAGADEEDDAGSADLAWAAMVVAPLALGGCAGRRARRRPACGRHPGHARRVLGAADPAARDAREPQRAAAADPGRGQPRRLRPHQQAVAGLTGRPVVNTASGAALVAAAGPRDPAIRSELAAEDVEWRATHRGLLLERVFSRDREALVYQQMLLDAPAEFDRIGARGVEVPAAPPAALDQ